MKLIVAILYFLLMIMLQYSTTWLIPALDSVPWWKCVLFWSMCYLSIMCAKKGYSVLFNGGDNERK